jgi:hypothetical protein
VGSGGGEAAWWGAEEEEENNSGADALCRLAELAEALLARYGRVAGPGPPRDGMVGPAAGREYLLQLDAGPPPRPPFVLIGHAASFTPY